MRVRLLGKTLLGVTSVLLALTAPSSAAVYPVNTCVSKKMKAAGTACKKAFIAWSKWERDPSKDPGDAKLNAALAKVTQKLSDSWAKAEGAAAKKGVDCAETTASSDAIDSTITAAVEEVVTAINDGVNFDDKADRTCRSKLLKAAAVDCGALLKAEGTFVKRLAKDPHAAKRDASKLKAADKFNTRWAKAACSVTPTADAIGSQVESISAAVVQDTTVSPNVDDTQYTTIAPAATVTYEKQQLAPQCVHGQPYLFFVKRGSVNKLLMYYVGGGACWDELTCSIPVCTDGVSESDSPNGASSGFADLTNPNNPFRDWNTVVVSYCSCDIHFGQSDQQYTPDLLIHHHGYDNARVAEKWAREHFVNPDVVFVTGSSAGAYGAWFHAALLESVWPASQFHVLADAGNGVVTQNFVETYFPNWNFAANIPTDIPGVQESLVSGDITTYTEAVATFFPDTTWSHYSTAYDGGSGGQTGFYNIMLNNNDTLAALTWWNGSCQFNQVMTQHVHDAAAVLTANNNYRYYIGTGSRHTMWGSNKVYTDTTGGVPTLVDWINGMLASTPPAADDPAWTDVECTNCGLLLPGDPQPEPLEPPFVQAGPNVVVQCP